MSHSRRMKRRAVVRSLLAGGAVWCGGSLAASAGELCAASPEETAGPFPADGSTHDGPGPMPFGRGQHPPGPPPGPPPGSPPPGADRARSVGNVLQAPGIVRADIRASFGGSATVAPGVPLRVELTLVDAGRACQPRADCAVYLWNCNRDGDYSLYGRGIEHENYLRGVQFSDSAGRVAFQTIFPACYSGRYPHLHLEIFKASARSLDAATRVLTTQLTAPGDICARVYAAAPGYSRSAVQFRGLKPSDDMVFASSSPAQLAGQTLEISGEMHGGFVGRATLGVHA
jgi:hypothetical protein